MYPMKRAGKKGEGKWERISWDEAFNFTAKKFKDIIDEYGGEAIGEIVYSGNEGFISKKIAPGNFLEKIGATRVLRNPCEWAKEEAFIKIFGTSTTRNAMAFKKTDMYISWGMNEAYTAVHFVIFAKECKQRGGKVITVNTIRTPMANFSDIFIQLKPSTDPAFCLGVCKVLIEEDLCDKKFIKRYAMGFDDLIKQTQEHTLKELADICGITVAEIELFAREYAKAEAPAIMSGDGSQRRFNGARMIRGESMLPVLVGALNKPGGGIFGEWTGVPCFNFKNVMPDISPKDENGKKIRRQLTSYTQIGKSLRKYNPTTLDPDSPTFKEIPLKTPLKALINYNTNVMVTSPNTNLIQERLLDEDFFLLVLDPFNTDTVDYADIVMPAGTFLESEDVQEDQICGVLQYNAAAAKPVGESKTNLEIFNGIARAMGYKDECFTWDTKTVLKKLLDNKFNKDANITYERLVVEGWIVLNRTPENMKDFWPDFPHCDMDNLTFKTDSGKIELYSKFYKDNGFHPCIDIGTDEDYYIEHENFGKEYLKKYPLSLVNPGTQLQNNSNWGSTKYITKRVLFDGYPEVFMCKEDAVVRGIREGTVCSVKNELGEAFFRARITSQVQPGVTYVWNNIWLKTTKTKTGANFLCSDGISDLGYGSTFQSTYVEISKV